MANEVNIVGKNNTPARITEKGEQVVTLSNSGTLVNIATSEKQDLLLTELQLKADLTEVQPTSLNSTVFTFSGINVNSSTTNLAAGTTFTGTIESVISQPAYSVLFFATQNCTIVINQYIDVAGSRLAQSTTYTYTASSQFARSRVLNGNYVQVLVTNNGGIATTSLQLDTAYGSIAAATQLNNAPMELMAVNGASISLGQSLPTASLPIVLSNVTATGTITTQNLVPAGTATANSAVEVTLNGYSNIAIQTTGTYTGALSLQGTVNGTTWVTLGGTPLININTGGALATITSALQSVFQAEVGGFLKVRVTGLAAMTGTATVTLIGSQASTIVDVGSIGAGSNIIGQVTQSGTWTAQIGNTPNTTPILTKGELGTSSLATSTNLNAAGTTNATSLKATAGMVGFISINNASASTRYFRLFNKSSAPTMGTDIPFMVVSVPASSSKEVAFSNGIEFTTGIAYAITGGVTATDSTAVTAGDVQLNITWQ